MEETMKFLTKKSEYDYQWGGAVKPYVIIKGGSANPYAPLQRGGEGESKIRKIALRNLWKAPY